MQDLKVFTVMKIHVMVFWVITPHSEVVVYQHFTGPHCLYLQDVMQTASPSKTMVSYHNTTWCHNPENHNGK